MQFVEINGTILMGEQLERFEHFCREYYGCYGCKNLYTKEKLYKFYDFLDWLQNHTREILGFIMCPDIYSDELFNDNKIKEFKNN